MTRNSIHQDNHYCKKKKKIELVEESVGYILGVINNAE